MEIPIPDDWDGLQCVRWVVCWPDSSKWRAIFQGLIENPSQGRFWDASTGNIVDTQNLFRPFYEANFEGNEAIMGCNDTGLLEGLQAIANSILQSSINNSNSANASAAACCDETITVVNGGIQGYIEQGGGGETIPIYGTEAPVTVPFGELPAGFETQEEWDASRCQIANGIFDGVVSALKWFPAINFGEAVGLGALILAGIGGMIVFPPLTISVLLSALMVLAGATGILFSAAENMEANREDWICFLMQDDNIELVIGTLADGIDVLVASLGTTTLIGLAIKTILLSLFNTDTLNQLMTNTAHSLYPEADCSACLCPFFTPDPAAGPKAETTVLEQTLTSVSCGGGEYSDRPRFDVGGTVNGHSFGDWCGQNLNIVSWELLSGSVEPGASVDPCRWLIYDNEGTLVYDDVIPPAEPICGAFLATVSAVANTWQAVFEECPE